jgi:hypothetical protein
MVIETGGIHHLLTHPDLRSHNIPNMAEAKSCLPIGFYPMFKDVKPTDSILEPQPYTKASEAEKMPVLHDMYKECARQCSVCNVLIFPDYGHYYGFVPAKKVFRVYCRSCGRLLRPNVTEVPPVAKSQTDSNK